MKSKKGISLIVLVITIIVMIILASVIVVTSASTTNNSKKVAFASDLEQIESLVREYYIANGSLPLVTSGTEYTKTTFINLITDGKSSLEDEISENGDDSSTFYKIDLSEIDIESTKRGLEEDGDATDAYFVAAETFNVYYLKGEKIANKYYFSLSEKLTGKSKVANSQTLDTSNITVSSVTGAIRLTKNTAEFTNALTVNVKVTLEAGETMKYMIAGQEISVAEGESTINVANIVSNSSTLKTAFYQSEENKYLLAQKYSNDNLIAEVKINIANLDILSGSMTSVTTSYSQYNKFILAKISGYTDLGGSGIKEAKVLYLTKSTGEAYYTNLPTTITKEYVKQAGKSFNATTLKLPTDVKTFALVFIDNAGNVSNVGTYEVSGIVFDVWLSVEEAKEVLEIGDVVEYTVTSKTEPSQAADNGYGLQNVSNQTNLTWRYIGVSDNGKIMIAPDVTSDAPSLTLSGENMENNKGYLNGPGELDRMCQVLYTTDKGTARSMKIEDVNNLLGYTGEKGSYVPSNGGYQPTPEPMTIAEIEKKIGMTMTYRDTPDGEDIGTYLSDYYRIYKEDDVGEMTYPEHRQYVYYGEYDDYLFYWLSSSFSTASFLQLSGGYDERRVWYSLCLRWCPLGGISGRGLRYVFFKSFRGNRDYAFETRCFSLL